MDYNFSTNDLLVIILALVFVVYIIAQTIIRWKETGSITESFRYAFDALGNAPIAKRGAEVVINRLDDKGRKAVHNLLNAADPFTDFVPGDWDQDTIDWVRGMLDKAPALTISPAGGDGLNRELERVKNEALTPNPSPSGRGEQPRQPLNVAVNQNPTMVHGASYGDWGDEAHRAKQTPNGYSMAWQPFLVDDKYAPPPEVQINEPATHGYTAGLEISLAHRRGRLIINQNVHDVLLPGQRYLLKAVCYCDLRLKSDAEIAGAIQVKGQICNGDAVLKNLPAWSPAEAQDLVNTFEALWVIGTGVAYSQLNYQVIVEVGYIHAVPFDDRSRIMIRSIELLPVSSEYDGARVVTF